uniref:Uncharacterized protein n=1 Tax=Anas platyrhynchos platyrhynchos TaxID=8840 RepID=A0A493TCS8_ANAPP
MLSVSPSHGKISPGTEDEISVHAANFSLHEAHCLLFLTLCPECDKPVAQNDMKSHQTEAHKQVRNAIFSSVKAA